MGPPIAEKRVKWNIRGYGWYLHRVALHKGHAVRVEVWRPENISKLSGYGHATSTWDYNHAPPVELPIPDWLVGSHATHVSGPVEGWANGIHGY